MCLWSFCGVSSAILPSEADQELSMSELEPTNPAATEKRCTQCGLDVTKRKRIKDRQGRYMCRYCHELFFGDPNQPSDEPPIGGWADGTAAGLDDTRLDEDGVPMMNNDSSTGTYALRTDRARGVDGPAGRSCTNGPGETGFGTRADTHPGVFTRAVSPGRTADADPAHESWSDYSGELGHDDPNDGSIVDADESAESLPMIGATKSSRGKGGADSGPRERASGVNLPTGQRIPRMEACYRQFAIIVGVQVMMHIALIGAAMAGKGWVPIMVIGMVIVSTAVACMLFARICRSVDWEGAHRVLLPIAFFVPIFGALAIVLAERRIRRRVVVRGGNPSIVAIFGEPDADEAAT